MSRSPYLLRSYRADLRLYPYTPFRVTVLTVGVLALLAYPLVLSPYAVQIANLALLAIVAVVGLQVVTGFAGQLSLGHAGFVATGAFTAAALQLHLGVPFWFGVPAGVLAAAALGVVAGVPARRLRGLYLGITTLALQYVVLAAGLRYQTYLQQSRGTSGNITVPTATIGGLRFDDLRSWYFLLLAVAACTVLFVTNLRRSAVGRDWISLRHSEVAAESLGVAVARRKIQAFVVSAAIGGLAGGLSAYYFRSVSVENYSLIESVEYLAMILVGGLGSVLGAVLGAVFFSVLSYLIVDAVELVGGGVFSNRVQSTQLIVFALITAVFLIYEPRGLAAMWHRVKVYFQRWPFGYRAQERTQR